MAVASTPSRRFSIGTPLKRRASDPAGASSGRTVSSTRTLIPSISRSIRISARTAESVIPVSSNSSAVFSISFPMCFHSMTSSFFMVSSWESTRHLSVASPPCHRSRSRGAAFSIAGDRLCRRLHRGHSPHSRRPRPVSGRARLRRRQIPTSAIIFIYLNIPICGYAGEDKTAESSRRRDADKDRPMPDGRRAMCVYTRAGRRKGTADGFAASQGPGGGRGSRVAEGRCEHLVQDQVGPGGPDPGDPRYSED
ncbi:hypothetical protein DSECCO2_642800 [anaerobic digester metagenome]